MKHDATVEYDALAWVKPELDALLDRARQSLEAYVGEQGRDDLLAVTAQVLRQVRGTLQVVDLAGAIMLAEEMEALVEALGDDQIRNREAALGVLSTAVLQLPDYLEYVQSGHPDTPIVILPLLNDLRAARDAELLSEKVVFVPDLGVNEQLPGPTGADSDPLESVAQAKRHSYQKSLLSVFRDQQHPRTLARMIEVFGALEAASRQATMRRLWWVAAALLETLGEGPVPVAVKLLLGRLDREIRNVIKRGEVACARELAPDLLKNLLYYVARAQTAGPRAQAVREMYHLDALLPGEGGLEAARRELSAPNLKLLETVSAAIREDLAEVRDQLEVYTHSDDTQAADFSLTAARLHKIADTLSMLGLGDARELVNQQAARVEAVAQGNATADDDLLMALASAILQTEQALQQLLQRRRGVDVGGEEAVVSNEITAAGVHEALRELNRVKNALLTYFAQSGEDTVELAEASKMLSGIIAALTLIGIEAPAARLTTIDQRLKELLDGAVVPTSQWTDALAEAITAVEMYLEPYASQRPEQQAFLGRADEALARLQPLAESPEPQESPLESTGSAGQTGVAEDLPSGAPAQEQEPAGEDETLPFAETLSLEEHGGSGVQPMADEPLPAMQPESIEAVSDELNAQRQELKALRDDADPEILDIFLEEAQEEVERIATLLPQWRSNHADDESMTSIRRSFHTLKGSGRLAGAQLLGEFAWAFENMLNRVMDQTVELHEEHFSLLDEALPALRQMVEQLNGGPDPEIDLFALMRRADAGASPWLEDVREAPVAVETQEAQETAPVVAAEPAATEVDLEVSGAEPAPQAMPTADEPLEEETASHIDPGLLDIYRREAEQHLAVIDDFLNATHGSGFAALIDEPLVIALHTLNGSAKTADIASLYRMFAPLESIALHLQKAGRPLPQRMSGVFQDALAAAEATLEALPDASIALPDTAELVGRIEAVLDGLESDDAPPAGARPATDEQEEPVAPEVDHDTSAGEAISFDHDAGETVAEPEEPGSIAEDGPVDVVDAHDLPPDTEASSDDEAAREVEAYDGPPAAEAEGPVTPTAVPTTEGGPASEARLPDLTTPATELGVPDRPDTLDAELVPVFLDEADEIMAGSDAAIQAWENGPGDAYASIETLQRELHTLKGGARMAGFSTVADLTHALETLITRIAEQGGKPGSDGYALVHAALDQLGDMLQQARAGTPIYPQAQLITRLADYGATPAPLPSAPPAVTEVETVDEIPEAHWSAPAAVDVPEAELPELPAETKAESAEPVESEPVAAAAAPSVGAASAAGGGGEQVRVRSELLNSLVNYAGEVNIYHARLQQQINGFGFNLNELRQTVSRLRDQLRKLELETEAQILYRFQLEQDETDEAEGRTDFDPLELDRYSNIQQLSRALAESLSDLVSIEDLLAEEVRNTETLLLQQQRVSTDLQEGLMRSRMVQFGRLAPRLRRVVRQTAATLGKRAELRLVGEQSEVDASVLDRLVAPLEHMLRNAVAHGIEALAQRQAAGKPETGLISVSVAREGSEVVVTVDDDGAGVDVEAVRAKALSQGLISADAQLDDHQVVQLILESGFSTAGEVSQIAGRGVGMGVVVREVKQLGGVLSIESEPGHGTRFVVRLPFTLTIAQALLAQAGDRLYALPLSGVEGVVRIPLAQLREVYAEASPLYEYLGEQYELKPLEALLGGTTPQLPEQDAGYYPLLLIRSGEQRVAVQFDALLGSREVVVKTLGPQFARLRGVAGGTILGDGRVALILDAADLARLASTQPLLTDGGAIAAPKEETYLPLIMVVDDSITIRKVTSRMLERNGFDVMTARDGMDAVAQLEERKPDLLITDIEMPRMDGYELSSHVRNDGRFRDIPIMIITSRSGEKHRQRAQELGVDRYLGKPYQEQELLDGIRELLPERSAAVPSAQSNGEA